MGKMLILLRNKAGVSILRNWFQLFQSVWPQRILVPIISRVYRPLLNQKRLFLPQKLCLHGVVFDHSRMWLKNRKLLLKFRRSQTKLLLPDKYFHNTLKLVVYLDKTEKSELWSYWVDWKEVQIKNFDFSVTNYKLIFQFEKS